MNINKTTVEVNGNCNGLKQLKNGGPPRKCYSIEVLKLFADKIILIKLIFSINFNKYIK